MGFLEDITSVLFQPGMLTARSSQGLFLWLEVKAPAAVLLAEMEPLIVKNVKKHRNKFHRQRQFLRHDVNTHKVHFRVTLRAQKAGYE